MYIRDSHQVPPRRPLADVVTEAREAVDARLARKAATPRKDARPTVAQSLAAVRKHVERMAVITNIYKGGRA